MNAKSRSTAVSPPTCIWASRPPGRPGRGRRQPPRADAPDAGRTSAFPLVREAWPWTTSCATSLDTWPRGTPRPTRAGSPTRRRRAASRRDGTGASRGAARPARARCSGRGPETERLVRRYLTGRGALLARRSRRARRDGHGDLIAEDIFCLDGRPSPPRLPGVRRPAAPRRPGRRRRLPRHGPRAARRAGAAPCSSRSFELSGDGARLRLVDPTSPTARSCAPRSRACVTAQGAPTTPARGPAAAAPRVRAPLRPSAVF